MKNVHRSLVAGLLLAGLRTLHATPSEAELAKEAKLTRNEAEHIALAKVPKGKVTAGELEREHGKLIWSFDISQEGTRDIKEVQVDAKSGAIVSMQTETPRDQAKEAAQDKKK